LSLAVFLGRNKSDQVKSSAIKFLAQSLMRGLTKHGNSKAEHTKLGWLAVRRVGLARPV
jgi:hypothetical protein